MIHPMDNNAKTQSDKFKDLAREVEADEDEAVFDARLRKMRDRKPEGGKDEASTDQA